MDTNTIKILKGEARKTIRHPVAKANITWSGRGIDGATVIYPELTGEIKANRMNRVSAPRQILNGLGEQRRWFFVTIDDEWIAGYPAESPQSEALLGVDDAQNDDVNLCFPMPDVDIQTIHNRYLVGLRGGVIGTWFIQGVGYYPITLYSGVDGTLSYPTEFTVVFDESTSIQSFLLNGDAARGEYPTLFSVSAESETGDVIGRLNLIKNTQGVNFRGQFPKIIQNVKQLRFTIDKWSHAYAFVKITAAYDVFSGDYSGDDIASMSILEETESTVGTLPIGGVSANELDLSLQNITDLYFFGNATSPYNELAKSGRRIEPHIGFALYDESGCPILDAAGEHIKEYAPKGVFWTRDWDVPEQGTTATTTAYDRMAQLQNIEYNGIDNNTDAPAQSTYWRNTSLYYVAIEILTDLRDREMQDLEFTIDDSLKNIVPKISFFEKQSYFDIIKTIAEAGLMYAYMDTPTEAEKTQAALRGNVSCADILRLSHINKYWQQVNAESDVAEIEVMSKRDYITQTQARRVSDIVNSITIPYSHYEIKDGVPVKDEDKSGELTNSNPESIKRFGRYEYVFPNNHLIQKDITGSDVTIRDMGSKILAIFDNNPVSAELSVFGDVTRKIGDILEIPEYQKGGYDVTGHYAVTRIQTEYGNGLRQTLTCRKVNVIPPPDANDYDVIEETGNAELIFDEAGNRTDKIQEKGVA